MASLEQGRSGRPVLLAAVCFVAYGDSLPRLGPGGLPFPALYVWWGFCTLTLDCESVEFLHLASPDGRRALLKNRAKCDEERRSASDRLIESDCY